MGNNHRHLLCSLDYRDDEGLKPAMKKEFWIGIIISGVFLFLFLRKLDFYEVLKALKSVNYWLILPAILLNLFSFYIRSIRWRRLLKHIKIIRTTPLLSATFIGFMANNLLPVRIGEFVRAYVIGKKENISKSASFATIVVERVFDIMAVLILFLTVSIVFSLKFFGYSQGAYIPSWLLKSGYYCGLLLGGMIFFLIIFQAKTSFILRTMEKLMENLPEKFTEKILHLFASFSSGINLFKNFKDTCVLIFLSVFMWLFFCTNLYIGFYAFDIENPSFISAIFLCVVLAIAVMIPSSPGFIGTFHLACKTGLIFLFPCIGDNKAGAMALIYHLIGFIPVTLVGFGFLLAEGLSWREISSAQKITP